MLGRLACFSGLFWVGLLTMAAPMREVNVDVAPFGYPLVEKESVGVKWAEMRRLVRVEIEFADGASPLPAQGSMQVQYWHQYWDGSPLRVYGEEGAGSVGWRPSDDWFNGRWKTADARVRVAGRKTTFDFAPSNEKEFPELKVPGVRYRPTLKVRVLFSAPHPRVLALRTLTDSVWQNPLEVAIRVEKRRTCDDPLEIHNGQLLGKRASVESRACVLRATIRYAHNLEDSEADRTIVTVRAPSHPFSFAMDDVVRGERIYVKDLGVLVSSGTDAITIPEYQRILQQSGVKCVYDRVEQHEEQTLSQAWRDMPLKPPYYFILGLEGGRQRFRLEPTGDLEVSVPNLPFTRPGRDDGHFLWPAADMKDKRRPGKIIYSFGLPSGRFADRTLAEGYLPMMTTRWLDGSLLYEQAAFADLLSGNLNSELPMPADDPVVAILRFRLVNHAPDSQKAQLRFSTSAGRRNGNRGRGFETLHADGERVMGAFEGRDVLRFLVDTRGAGKLTDTAEGVRYELELPGHQEHTIYLKVPFITLTDDADIERLRALQPEREREEVARFWRTRVAKGTEIRTPEAWLNDFYKAHLTHLLINNERELDADRYVARVGSFSYGAYGNEATMMISDLDRRGYSQEAERSLELFLHYQGTVRLPGNFTTQKGILYGAGGYESGDYNQHHGWILWGLAEHYWYTRDRAWMDRVASKVVDACRWVLNERKGTMKLDARGQHVPEYGLLPAGSLEDVTDFWYWLSTNAFSWWGVSNAAAALQDRGHPEGATLVADAENYRQDILRAFREAMVRSPVVRLRDGTYVPTFPSDVYTRGRSVGWLRETLEGSIMLAVTRLLDPNSREAEWILKDFEDNRYISDRFGYSIPLFDRFWFSRGGFSMQPNLLHGPLPYFYRDQIEHFVRTYFNSFASAYDPTLRMLCEHPLPELGAFSGDQFKTSDEAQSAYWLRLMFVAELDGALHLGRGLPRYWLKDGETIGIRNASTYFGKVSYEIRSQIKDGRIEVSLDPPARDPFREMVLRLRHPEGRPIRKVSVNGQPWEHFQAAEGQIRLPSSTQGHTEVVAEY